MFYRDKEKRENNRLFMNRKMFRKFGLKVIRNRKYTVGLILIAIASAFVFKVEHRNASNTVIENDHSEEKDSNEEKLTDIEKQEGLDTSKNETDSSNQNEIPYENSTSEEPASTDTVDTLESDVIEEEYTLEDAYLYTGYMDLHPAFAQECPIQDCDGDEMIDRVYKEYRKETHQTCIRLDFGNGESLILTEEAWGQWFRVEHGDFTGDGNDEIVFYQYLISTGGFMIGTSIFTKQDNKYTKMELVHEVDDDFTTGQIVLPISLTKLGEHSVLLKQPDSGVELELSTVNQSETDGEYYDEMEHLWSEEIDGKVIYYPAQEIQIVDSDDKTKKVLYLSTYLGDKWCDIKVDWVLEYENHQWIIKKVLA